MNIERDYIENSLVKEGKEPRHFKKMDHCYYFKSHYQNDDDFHEIVFQDEMDRDGILISLVQSHPYLYNKELSDFKDGVKKENAWIEIARILNMKVDECQTRWTRLRERYTREKKQRQEETTTGSAVLKRKTFEFFDNMQFLEPFIKKRRTMSNVQIKRTPSSVEYSSLQKNFDSHGGKQIYLSSTNAITSDENNDNNVPIKNTPLSTGYSNLQKNFDSHGGRQIYLSSTNAITSDENNDNNVPIKNTPPSTGYSNFQKNFDSHDGRQINVTSTVKSVQQSSINNNEDSEQYIFKVLPPESENSRAVPQTRSPSQSPLLCKTPLSPSPVPCIKEFPRNSFTSGYYSNSDTCSTSTLSVDSEPKKSLSGQRIKSKGRSQSDFLQNAVCKVTSLLESRCSTTSSSSSLNPEIQEDVAFVNLYYHYLEI